MTQIVINAVIKVKPAYIDEVIHFFNTELITQSREEKGNVQYDLHRGLQNKNTLFVYEIWTDQAAIDEHNLTNHFKTFQAYIGDKVESVDITLFTKQ